MNEIQWGDGKIYHEDRGTGAPPALLLHGLGCDHRYFAPQIEHLSRSRRVVAPDLRGHGRTSLRCDHLSTAEIADDIAWLCRELKLESPVIIGHSLGGNVALELARRHHGVPGAIVAIDAAIAIPPEALGSLDAAMKGIFAADDPGIWENVCAQYMGPACPPDVKARILADFMASPKQFIREEWEQTLSWDAAGALRACTMPLLCVDIMVPFKASIVLDACPHAQIEKLSDIGHYVTLEAPEQLNAVLDRFLATLS